MQRVDPKAVAAMVDASKDSLAAAAEPKVEKKKERKLRKSLNLKWVKLKSLVLKTL
jgi:methionyl-tRNA synthetase